MLRCNLEMKRRSLRMTSSGARQKALHGKSGDYGILHALFLVICYILGMQRFQPGWYLHLCLEVISGLYECVEDLRECNAYYALQQVLMEGPSPCGFIYVTKHASVRSSTNVPYSPFSTNLAAI